jgi:hypothetical protein
VSQFLICQYHHKAVQYGCKKEENRKEKRKKKKKEEKRKEFMTKHI